MGTLNRTAFAQRPTEGICHVRIVEAAIVNSWAVMLMFQSFGFNGDGVTDPEQIEKILILFTDTQILHAPGM